MTDTFTSYQVDSNPEDPTGYAQNREMNPATETGGVVRVTTNGQGGGTTEITRVTSSQALDGHQIMPEGAVLESLQTKWGSPKSSFGGKVDPSDTIELQPGLRTSVANAAQMGVVRVGPDGSLQLNPSLQQPSGPIQRSSSAATADSSSEQQEASKGYKHTQPLPEDPHMPTELEDRRMAAAIDTMTRGLDPVTLREVNRQIAQGQVTDQGLEQVATTLGTSFEDAAEIINAAASGYQSLHDNAMNQAGLATDRVQGLFADWALRERTGQWRQAQADFFAFRSNTQMAKLARDFMATFDTVDPEETIGMLNDAGYQNVRKTDRGSVVFDHPDHGTVSWTQAYKAGLFRTPVAKNHQ
jgi:hypothetical protein